MTDAERIAEYLTAVSASGEEWTLADVQRNAGLRGGRSNLLLAMLSDVRREEREACASVAEDPRFMNAPAWERQSLIAYWIRERGSK